MEHFISDHETFKVIEDINDRPDSGGPINIVISFDGSGGDPDWGIQKTHGPRAPLYTNETGLTNVCKLHLIAGGNIGNTNKVFPDQVPYYYTGVGTRRTIVGNLISNVPYFISSGISLYKIAEMAWNDLNRCYKEGDRIFVFGFSRGAASARLFVDHLSKHPIRATRNEIAFLGVYDTVPQSIAVSTGTSIKAFDYPEKKTSEMPAIVKKAVHFVAIDEYRNNFVPTLFDEDDRVTEIWCPGCHSDIGGGYYNDGISDTVLKCMLIEAKKAGLETREITKEICENQHQTLIELGSKYAEDLFAKFDNDMKICPNGLDPDVHDSRIGMTSGLFFRFVNFVKRFSHRDVTKMRNDEAAVGEPILLLDIAVERAQKLVLEDDAPAICDTYETKKYRPKHMVGIPYKVVNSKDMTIGDTVYEGMEKLAGW